MSMMQAIIPAKLLLHNIYRTLSKKKHLEDILTIDQHCRHDLTWWLESIKQWNGTPLPVKTPEIQIEMDALGIGWGSCCRSLNLEPQECGNQGP